MDPGGRYETFESETQDFIIHGSESSTIINMFVLIAFVPKSHGVIAWI